jgi:hypothetical protein
MAEHCLIQRYNEVLLAELPVQLAEEVADGLAEANSKYLRQGLSQDDAAHAAISEFGDARAVVEAFTRSSPARHTARRLIATGPIVGGCWAVALITGRAWEWPIPNADRLLLGATLIGSVIVVLTAAMARRYRLAQRAGVAGCAGLALMDASAIAAVLTAAPSISWLAVLAACASTSRLICVARAVHSGLA